MVNTVPNRLKLRTIAFGLLQQVGARSPPPSPHSFVIILKALKGQTRNNSVVRNFSKTNGFSSITHYDVTKHWRTHCRTFKHLVSQMYTITLILFMTVSFFLSFSFLLPVPQPTILGSSVFPSCYVNLAQRTWKITLNVQVKIFCIFSNQTRHVRYFLIEDV